MPGTLAKPESRFVVSLLNVQGLTNEKYTEIQERIGEKTLMFLTETQKKVNDIRVGEGYTCINKMRNTNQMKGGGLMALFRESEDFHFEEQETINSEYLHIRGRIGAVKAAIILAYLRTGTGEEVRQWNQKIALEIQKILETAEAQEEFLLIAGDFNAHLGYIGYQEENENGKIVNEMIERNNLILLNLEEKCSGTYTWSRGEQKSAIDFIMVNDYALSRFLNMKIDEDGEELDISDHCLIQTSFIMKTKVKGSQKETKKVECFKFTERRIERYKEEVENELAKIDGVVNIEELNEVIRKAADRNLKVIHVRKTQCDKRELPWMKEEIKKEIAKRRTLNKEHRRKKGSEAGNAIWLRYCQQKQLVKMLISEAMREYENGIARSVMEDRSGRKMWEHIGKLKGEVKPRRSLKIYDELGEELKGRESVLQMKTYWEQIYKMSPNKMTDVWNETLRQRYVEQMEVFEETVRITQNPLNLPRVGDPYKRIVPMNMHITMDKLVKAMKKMKNRRAGGEDGLRPEMYKVFEKNGNVMETLRESLCLVLENREEPASWKASRTVMIPKKRRPTAEQLRPLAMTDVSYKIMMALIREEIDQHLKDNNMRHDEQAGFTRGGNIMDNMIILQECVQETYRTKGSLFLVSVDFSKAFDSIKRETIVEVLKEYRVDERVIDLVVRIYVEDKTRIAIAEEELTIDVESGIRQGCTASTTFFKMITYKVIEELKRRTRGMRVVGVKVSCLFYADDGMLVSDSKEEALNSVKVLQEVGLKYGLKMNESKTKCMIFNYRQVIGDLDGIEVVDELKYLGVTMKNERNVFGTHRSAMIEKIRKMSCLTSSVIEKSNHRVLIGKTYWKGVVLPSVLYGMEAINLRVEDVEKLQRSENSMLRRLLRAPRRAAVAGMRGEVGIGTMKTRIIRGRLQYIRRVIQGENALMKKILERLAMANGPWMRWSKKYLECVGLCYNDLKTMTGDQVKRAVAVMAEREWREEVEKRSTLNVYRMFKKDMKEEEYDGGFESVVWFRARTNCLELNGVKREEEERICGVCGLEVEDLRHFVARCVELESERREAVELQRPRWSDEVQVVGRFLFPEVGPGNRRVLCKMWRKRRRILENVNT